MQSSVCKERFLFFFFAPKSNNEDGLILFFFFLMLLYNRDKSCPGSLIIPVIKEAVILWILFYWGYLKICHNLDCSVGQVAGHLFPFPTPE